MARKPAQASAPKESVPPAYSSDPRDEIIASLQHQLAAMETRFVALEQSTSGMQLLPPEEMPIFEVGPGGYYSADDVLYPEGVQIEDITGRMPLNEQLIPLNEPAEIRLERYLASLPQHGTPNHEFVLEAAFRRLGELSGAPEDRAAFFAGVLEDAAKIRMKQIGLMPGREEMPRAPVRPAGRAPNVPIMPNTRIRHDASPLGHAAPPPVPARGPAQTRMRAPAAAPANKSAPPLGTVPQSNLGTAGSGARAA